MIKFKMLLFGIAMAISVLTAIPSSGQNLAKKAEAFLNTLSPDLRAKAQFSFGDAERFNWNFVPIARRGPSFRDFDEKQKNAAISLLRASLSDQGYQKVSGIIELENVLKVLENRALADNHRDPMNYHLSIFGEPSSSKEWGWRFEGHHISLNFSSIQGVLVSATPSFLGSNPGTVNSGVKKGTQILKKEMELGFLLLNSLNEVQLKKTRFAEKAPAEIITGNSRKASLLSPPGIQFTELNASQKKIFMQLLDVYIRNFASEFSGKFLANIQKAGLDNLHFAWAGSLTPGGGHYYRIQGKVLLIEYDNTQNNSNHVHTVVRDLMNDFGEDVLKGHYQKQDHHH
ncbi:DUF3500 domain-containing protein [Daejeonella sp.]|uniref:DUF3500 domain-containing protein n=1 Tax=Daejeonella sp. TaxID=2805397 RepID=UPI0030BB4BE6